MTEAGIAVMLLQIKECQELTAIQKAKRKTWNRFFPRAFKNSITLGIL